MNVVQRCEGASLAKKNILLMLQSRRDNAPLTFDWKPLEDNIKSSGFTSPHEIKEFLLLMSPVQSLNAYLQGFDCSFRGFDTMENAISHYCAYAKIDDGHAEPVVQIDAMSDITSDLEEDKKVCSTYVSLAVVVSNIYRSKCN